MQVSPSTVFVFCLAIAVGYTNAQAVPIKNCGGSAKFDTSKIQISGCGQGGRCKLVKGQNARIELPFTPTTGSSAVTAKVNGILASIIPVPFQLPNENGCTSGLSCPLAEGVQQIYVNELPVSPQYPSLNVGIEWKLLDELNNELVCIRIPATLVDSA